ncbi:MAG: 16S rRNA (uracil(1498)-N(3))-methyltransferase [Nitrosospira sp.]|nr:16S rRNA (uracil(1498)-N(3))-methyltransferase [Nitrosospira sp.]
MAPPRFYCPGKFTAGQAIELPANVAHHASRVLRLKQGDSIILFNGNGGEFQAAIGNISKNGVAIVIEKYLDIERESPLVITLAQAVCASEKMDWLVQKAVELGVSSIQPLDTKRSVVRLSGERAERRMKHWQQVVISACEQCGRNRIPQVLPLISLADWLGTQVKEWKNLRDGTLSNLHFLLSPTAKKGLRDFPEASATTALTLLVGPEGGLTSEEEAAALVSGFISLRLGKRIFRTESAALAAVAAMQMRWGDY